MTTQRDFKRIVRTRMQKTGESYTAARAQLLRRPATSAPALTLSIQPVARPAPKKKAAAPDYAALAGMSDAAIKKSTGCAWASWVNTLDHHGADQWPHRAIAELVHEKYGVKPWWTQAVAVGYERIKGLREIGQRRGGSYEASRSRTFDVSMTKLYNAFATPKGRSTWLKDVQLTVRKATKNRSMRITWADGTSIELWFSAKDKKKSVVQLTHAKLATKADVEQSKAYWGKRLDALEATFA